jgi:hypothetical protein
MKPKSFKSKELGDGLQPLGSALYTFDVNQIELRDKFIAVVTLNDDWTSDLTPCDIVLGDIVALAIDSDPQVLLARVENVVQLGEIRQAILVEHNKQLLGSSKSKQTPSPSPGWTSFLKELKKKCGSGHHNKKKKRLLHVVRTARNIEAKPASIKLTVRQMGAAGDDLVSQIIDAAIAEADQAGQSVDLNDITEIIPEVPAAVIAADYVPPAAPVEAMTCVINGVDLRRYFNGSKETIRISKEFLDNAVRVHTGDPIPFPESLSDPTVNWVFTAYGHGQDVATHNIRAVNKISLSPDGLDYDLELPVGLEARGWWFNNKNDYHLVVLSGYKAKLDEDLDEFDHFYDGFDYGTLAIRPDMYEFLPVSNDDPMQRLRITYPLALDRERNYFVEGERHLASVDNTLAVFRVKSTAIDAVKKEATVVFGYEGREIGQSPYAQQRGELSMKRALSASSAIDAALMLTLEKASRAILDDADVDADGEDGIVDDPGQVDLEAIVANLKELLGNDPDRDVPLSEVTTWVDQNQGEIELKVTGADYMAPQQPTETSTSVSGIAQMDVFESTDGKFVFIDIKPDIENVKSLVYRSRRLAEDALEPDSEVKERSFAAELDDLREDEFGVVSGGRRVAYVSIYSRGKLFSGEKGGYAVCNNEQIWRVLRKKKDGKCIYRIVMKKGVRANRMAYGKHEKCVMYIHRYTSVDSMPAD